jgi:hypothetical protein
MLRRKLRHEAADYCLFGCLNVEAELDYVAIRVYYF